MSSRRRAPRRLRSLARGVAVLVLVGAACTACASRVPDTSTAGPVQVSGSSAAQKCPPLSSVPGGGNERTLTTTSGQRTFNLWLPQGYDATKPVPLIIDYHGAGEQSLEYATKDSGMSLVAPARGYLLATPQGGTAGGSPLWSYPGYSTPFDDVGFTEELVQTLSEQYCVDLKRVYATGISQGAGFSTYLSCRLPTMWAAVAPLSGVNLVIPCPDRPPVPVVAFHGTTDPIVPFEGDTNVTVTPPPTEAYLGDVQAVMDVWARRNGCTAAHTDTTVAAMTTLRAYVGCPPGREVQLYISTGTGHTYPGGPAVPAARAAALGGQSQSIDAAKVIVDFFDQHQRS